MQLFVLTKVSDKLTHCGFDKMLHRIQETYWFPLMRKHIRDYLDNSQRVAASTWRASTKRGRAYLIVRNTSPRSLQSAWNNGRWLQISRCHWRVFKIHLFPTKSTGAKEVYNQLQTSFDIVDLPSEIVTDRGTAFTSNEFSTFLDTLNFYIPW